ncbi:exodeoxyribonuclease VII large subunit [Candidatus Saccharibacteria bacterium]|nr:exodeoxyribonuclease VII large subunit [Candidatus Saccharibacteria bacterium]
MDDVLLSVSDFVALTNQTLEYAYPVVQVEGEVAEFKVIQNKWVSFKLKDAGAIVSCFTGLYQMRIPLEDGMKVVVIASPRLNNKGFFTLNLKAVKPVGEGSIKKGFELLKAKLEAEGLFAVERKRPLPRVPKYVGVIASTESAGYADFIKIINERWGGLAVDVAHTQVQGIPAPDQMIRAIRYFNSLEVLPEVLIIIRGGGSAEDLSTFNDEPLVRAIAESRIPTLVGVGHEVDHTLADMVSDVRAATPTNAAQILVPDKAEIIRGARAQAQFVGNLLTQAIDNYARQTKDALEAAFMRIQQKLDDRFEQLGVLRVVIAQLNPENVLRRGYALLRGEQKIGATLEIETLDHIIKTEVQDVRSK